MKAGERNVLIIGVILNGLKVFHFKDVILPFSINNFSLLSMHRK